MPSGMNIGISSLIGPEAMMFTIRYGERTMTTVQTGTVPVFNTQSSPKIRSFGPDWFELAAAGMEYKEVFPEAKDSPRRWSTTTTRAR